MANLSSAELKVAADDLEVIILGIAGEKEVEVISLELDAESLIVNISAGGVFGEQSKVGDQNKNRKLFRDRIKAIITADICCVTITVSRGLKSQVRVAGGELEWREVKNRYGFIFRDKGWSALAADQMRNIKQSGGEQKDNIVFCEYEPKTIAAFCATRRD